MLIEVKWLGPTNTKPSRWKASRSGLSVTVLKGLADDTNEDAKRAAYALIEKMEDSLAASSETYESQGAKGWGPLAYCGQTDSGLYIFASIRQLERKIKLGKEAYNKANA